MIPPATGLWRHTEECFRKLQGKRLREGGRAPSFRKSDACPLRGVRGMPGAPIHLAAGVTLLTAIASKTPLPTPPR